MTVKNGSAIMIQAFRSQSNQDITVFTVINKPKLHATKYEGDSSDSCQLVEILFEASRVFQVSLEEPSVDKAVLRFKNLLGQF